MIGRQRPQSASPTPQISPICDVERAVRAGLDLVAAAGQLGAEAEAARLAARAGEGS
jgi:hypothetical protein